MCSTSATSARIVRLTEGIIACAARFLDHDAALAGLTCEWPGRCYPLRDERMRRGWYFSDSRQGIFTRSLKAARGTRQPQHDGLCCWILRIRVVAHTEQFGVKPP